MEYSDDYIFLRIEFQKGAMIVTRKTQKCAKILRTELLAHISVGESDGNMLSFQKEKCRI